MDRHGKVMSLRDSKKVSQLQKDLSRWEENRLLTSGAVRRLERDDEDNTEQVPYRVAVLADTFVMHIRKLTIFIIKKVYY